MLFANCYENAVRAEAYAKLEFRNTYHLAFHDLPALFSAQVKEKTALDFGCGTGRSTRYLRQLGFEAVGVDIAPEMLQQARAIDPQGDYRLIPGDDMSGLPSGKFGLVLSAFTFDNVPATEKVRLLRELRRLLRADGVMVSIVSSPEIYVHEWASFTTKEFVGENRKAGPGDLVRIVTTDIADASPAVDVLCPDESYRAIYREAGLEVVEMLRPLATGDEAYAWVSEREIAPWTIYALRSSHPSQGKA